MKIVGDFKVSLDSLAKWSVGFEFFYMAHGIMYKDLGSDWIHIKMKTPSSEDATDFPTNGSGVPEYFFRLSSFGGYEIKNWLSFNCGFDNWFILNKNNMSKSLVSDLQIHFGMQIKK